MVRDHRIETYTYQPGSVIGANFGANSWRSINGILMAVRLTDNNYDATGSLALITSGTGEVVWSMISGTTTGNPSMSGLFYPVTPTVNPINTSLSGTNSVGVWSEIPLVGTYTLVGSGLGASKSGAGITLLYKMG